MSAGPAGTYLIGVRDSIKRQRLVCMVCGLTHLVPIPTCNMIYSPIQNDTQIDLFPDANRSISTCKDIYSPVQMELFPRAIILIPPCK